MGNGYQMGQICGILSHRVRYGMHDSDLSVRLFHQRVRGLALYQCKCHFDSMYGGLDTPYGSDNMKTAKAGSLDI